MSLFTMIGIITVAILALVGLGVIGAGLTYALEHTDSENPKPGGGQDA